MDVTHTHTPVFFMRTHLLSTGWGHPPKMLLLLLLLIVFGVVRPVGPVGRDPAPGASWRRVPRRRDADGVIAGRGDDRITSRRATGFLRVPRPWWHRPWWRPFSSQLEGHWTASWLLPDEDLARWTKKKYVALPPRQGFPTFFWVVTPTCQSQPFLGRYPQLATLKRTNGRATIFFPNPRPFFSFKRQLFFVYNESVTLNRPGGNGPPVWETPLRN